MKYNQDAISHLTELIRGNDEARAWLVKNNFPELVLLHYAINNYDDALRELTNKKHIELTAFTHAVRGDTSAFNWLAENNKFVWAATVSMINRKDRNAEAWLIKNNYHHFAELGRAIRQKELDEQEDDIFGLFARMIRFFQGRTHRKAIKNLRMQKRKM